MATVPLNYFRRISTTLPTTLTQVYSAPDSTAAIMLTMLASNDTANPQTITVGISGLGGQNGNIPALPYVNIVKNFVCPPNDVTNIIIGKVVLQNYDTVYALCTGASAVDLTISILETLNTTAVVTY
jgi:hypothetical protein